MNNISFSVDNPWLFLLLIPAVILALFPYFRLKKKRRRTRNRIVSMILHIAIIFCCILCLGNIQIHSKEQVSSEIILITDVSESMTENKAKVNNYLSQYVKNTSSSSKLGVLTFGYGDKYGKDANIKFTGLKRPGELNVNSFEELYNVSDNTGSDIENAIIIAREIFKDSTSSSKKIVLLTDGLETDGNIENQKDILGGVYNSVDAKDSDKIEVSVVFFENDKFKDTAEAQIDEFVVPERAIPYSSVVIKPILSCIGQQNIHIKVTDSYKFVNENGREESKEDVIYDGMVNGVTVGTPLEIKDHIFEHEGIHVLKAEISPANDVEKKNNVAYAYVDVNNDRNVLLIGTPEKNGSEEVHVNGLANLLKENGFDVKSFEVEKGQAAPADMPKTASELKEYGEVILMNINTTQLPNGFDLALDEYVKEGGGLLTTGGDNTYKAGNMEGTQFEQFLPMDINPVANNPRAIVVVLDISNSMFMYDVPGKTLSSKPGDASGLPGTRIDVARKGLISALKEGIGDDDYLGLVVFGRNKKGINDTEVIFELTKTSHEAELIEKIQSVHRKSSEGSTNSDEALLHAARMVNSFTEVKEKTVVFISDDDGKNDTSSSYLDTIQNKILSEDPNNKIGFQGIIVSNSLSTKMQNIQNLKGIGPENMHLVNQEAQFTEIIKELCKSYPSAPLNDYSSISVSPEVNPATPAGKGVYEFPLITGYNGTSLKEANVNTGQMGGQAPVTYHNTGNLKDENGNDKLDGNGNSIKLDNIDPIYAWWNYGEGKVGSIMTGVNGKWSNHFYDYTININGVDIYPGQVFMKNVVTDLYGAKDTIGGMKIDFDKDNFTQNIKVETDFLDVATNKNFILHAKVYDMDGRPMNDAIVGDGELSFSGASYRGKLQIRKPGVYRIELTKSIEGGMPQVVNVYTAFSYSKEYNAIYDGTAVVKKLNELCQATGGTLYYEMDDVSVNISDQLEEHEEISSFQIPLMIIALLLFLIDIAVRKFNFLWPHEIIRKLRNKEETQQ